MSIQKCLFSKIEYKHRDMMKGTFSGDREKGMIIRGS